MYDEYGGFWIRAAALILDTILCIVAYYAVEYVAGQDWLLTNIAYQIFCLAYFTGFVASKWQATPGKMAVQLMVADTGGHRLSVPHALTRYLVWGVPGWPWVLWSLQLDVETLEHNALVLQERTETLEAEVERIEGDDAAAEALFQELLAMPEMQAMLELAGIFGALGLFFLIVGLIWYLPVAFSQEKTGIHDMICKTRVCRRD